MTGGLVSALFSGMWHGYRRWMTLFNSLSIVLSVTLAMVILGFTHGVRRYVDDMVRKEAAAGAVRIHAGGWQVESAEERFAERVRRADTEFSGERPDDYLGFNFWSRSEAHYLMPQHPADSELGGVFVKMGNTYPADPEAERVAPYAVAGRWIEDDEAEEIVLGSAAAVKLAKRIGEVSSVEELVGRRIWITLPPTREHLPGACARVEIVGIFDHLRDGACMTTPRVIQDMHARTQANAYGKWYETYDRMRFHVRRIAGAHSDETRGTGILPVSSVRPRTDPEHSVDASLPSHLAELNARIEALGGVPLICWRVREYSEPWLAVRGAVGRLGETEVTRALRVRAAEAKERLESVLAELAETEAALEETNLLLQGSEETRQWLADLEQAARAAFAEAPTPDAAARLKEMVNTAADRLQLDVAESTTRSEESFATFFDSVMGRIKGRQAALGQEAATLGERRERLASEAPALGDKMNALAEEADALAAEPVLPEGGMLAVEAAGEGAMPPLMATGPVRSAFPASEHSDLARLDARYPEGYVLCSPRIWNNLGYAAAPSLPVDGWRDHALYAYLYFDGLQPALAAREQLQRWGFETYMPIDRFKGLLSLVGVVTWAAVALLAAVLLAGLLGIVVTLYTEVDAEEAEIGLLKALGASNRLVGLVFLCKGALIGLVGVGIGVPLAAFVTGRINAGVSEAVARAAGLADVDAGLFRMDPWLAGAMSAAIVGLAALAALMPALQAAARDPQEALRAE